VSADGGPRRSFLTGLLGQGVGPSLSPELHEREGHRHGLRYVYKLVELDGDTVRPEYLRGLLDAAVHLGFDGLNVTHPVKQVMLPLVDRLAPEAAAIGALNTVLVRGGETVGHNTDVSGFGRAMLDELPGVPLDHVVLLGAGGAGAAVAHALAGLGVARLDVVDPDLARAERLATALTAADVPIDAAAAAPDDVPARVAAASGLVNATPVGMTRHPGLPCPAEVLRPDLWVVDIVYRPLVTELLAAARDRGCRTMSGARMAVHQAADTFELVTGLAPDRAAMVRDFDALVAREARASDHDAPSSDTNHQDHRTDERNS
jgi:shikimate dehydrogenase